MKSAAFAAALALAAPAAFAQPAPAPAAPAPAAPVAAAPAAAPPAAAPAAAPAPAAPAAPEPCTTARGLNFVCGLANVEDMLPIDNGKQIVAGSFKEGSAGLYLIDTAAKTARPVTLSVSAKPDPQYGCPGAPDLTKLSTHGLDVKPGRGDTDTVYAVNHGGRESIEIFTLDERKGSAEWIGCILAPPNASLNSVAAVRDGSILFTKFYDTTDKAGIQDVLAGKVTGTVYRWTPGKGISEVPGTQLSGDNGLVVSRDGKTVYVNAYGTREVWKAPLNGKGERKSAKVEFNPDNLRWAPDGTIFVTGQYIHPDNLAGPNDWGVARLDTENMHVHNLLTAPGMKAFDNATTAVVAGNQMWLGTFRGDRVAYMPAP